ncbi:MAG: hypothetical protein IJW44_01205 [Clostridia bacterium]|nr:hypothetical protein [Clostridia bacterium]
MIPLLIVGCVILLIALFWLCLLSLKATLTIAYHEELTLTARVLFFKISLYPTQKEKKGPHSMSAAKAERIRKRKAKKAAKKKEAAKAKKERKAEQAKEAGKKKKKSMAEILDMLSLVCKLASTVIRRFVKHLRIKVARLKIKVATPDAAATAVAYGAVTQSINVLLPILEQVKNFSLPDVADLDVQADFLSETPEADIEISFSLRVWHVLDIAIHGVIEYFKHQSEKEGSQA